MQDARIQPIGSDLDAVHGQRIRIHSAAAAAAGSPASESTGSAAQSQRHPQPQPKRPRPSDDHGDDDQHTDGDITEANGSARASLHAASTDGATALRTAAAPVRTSDGARLSQTETSAARLESTCADALGAFFRLLQRDPAVCAAVLQHICQNASHLLQAQSQPSTHASAPSAAPSLHHQVEAESLSARQIRLDRLRDSALVAGTIALTLSFLPLAERLKLGRISRGWHGATRQASLWHDAGWRFGESDLPAPPLWLRSSLGHVNCLHTCLMSAAKLAVVGSAAAARHLSIRFDERTRVMPTVSATDIRRALHSLRLLSLSAHFRSIVSYAMLWEALIGPLDATSAQEADGRGEQLESDGATGASAELLSWSLAAQPLLHRWAPTLTALHLHALAPFARLLAIFTDRQWPSLRSLSLQFSHRDDPAVVRFAVQLLEALVSAQHPPPLTKLLLHVDVDHLRQNGRPTNFSLLTSALLAALQRMPGLTELDVDFALGLTEEQLDGRLPGLHLLPSLRVLRCGFDMAIASGPAFVKSVALAPRLEVLQLLTGEAVSEMCTELHKQSQCAPASDATSSSIMEGSGRDGPVLLRELHLPTGEGRYELGDQELQSLSALSHLERLRCCVRRDSISWLGGLRGLRSLTLTDVEWRDADVCLLAELPLPLLSTLKLRPAYTRVMSGYGCTRRSSLQMIWPDLTVAGSLRHLLQMAPLRLLRLPPLSLHPSCALFHLLTQLGRVDTLHVEEETGKDDDTEAQKPASLFLCKEQPRSATATNATIALNDN